MRIRKVIVVVLQAVVAIVKVILFPLRVVFGPLFSWLDRRLALRDQAEFEVRIRREAEVLFEEYGAHVVANEGVIFPPRFDGAFVTLQADGMLIRFSKGRGDYEVRIAAVELPREWTDLELLISALETPDDMRRKGINCYPDKAGRALDRHWEAIKKALRSDSILAAIREYQRIHGR